MLLRKVCSGQFKTDTFSQSAAHRVHETVPRWLGYKQLSFMFQAAPEAFIYHIHAYVSRF